MSKPYEIVRRGITKIDETWTTVPVDALADLRTWFGFARLRAGRPDHDQKHDQESLRGLFARFRANRDTYLRNRISAQVALVFSRHGLDNIGLA